MAQPFWFDPNRFDPDKIDPEKVKAASTSELELADVEEQRKLAQALARYEKLFNYEPLGGGSHIGGAAAALAKGFRGYDYAKEQQALDKRRGGAITTFQDMVAEYLRNMQKKPDSEYDADVSMRQREDFSPPSWMDPY